MRVIRLYRSACADVRYVYGYPVAIPFRRNFESDADHKAALKRHSDAKAACEADEARPRIERKRPSDERIAA